MRAGSERPALERQLGRWDLTAAVINGVIGSCIFGLPAVLAALTGVLSPLAALAAGGGILLIVLCFAEVGSRFREHGGVYLYARAAYGPLVGFEVGWLLIWTRLLSAAAIPQKEMPDIQIDMVIVSVEYCGAAPDEVEEDDTESGEGD